MQHTVAVVGLGYVGLPLAIAFGKHLPTIGFDLSQEKVEAYLRHEDPMGEVQTEDFSQARFFEPTNEPDRLKEANFILVAVPTPVDAAKQPDLTLLSNACTLIGANMRAGTTVVFESTVYPGITEEHCAPLLQKTSGLVWKKDFWIGYSPERINPGDKKHGLADITKVVAGDTPRTLTNVANLYEHVVAAGVYRCQTIKEAEAAKVIENTQRDLNIAFMNELAIIFDKLGIDTLNVLRAAGTKWNFLPFQPGLVGGHCIGVDPYYLTYKAQMAGYTPKVILAGRNINDGMGKFIAEKSVKLLIARGRNIKGARALVCGLTFKEDCPDIRNSKTVDIVRELQEYGIEVVIHDPLAAQADAKREYGLTLTEWEKIGQVEMLVCAVAHQYYKTIGADKLLQPLEPGGVVIDVKSFLPQDEILSRGYRAWRL